MSSSEDQRDYDEFSQVIGDGSKRRKITRACDACRRRKIRCDAATQPTNKCSHCLTSKLTCTFVEASKKRHPPKGYIDDLERRCEALEQLVRKVAPHVDVETEVGPRFNLENWASLKTARKDPLVRPVIINVPKATLPTIVPPAPAPPSPTLEPSFAPLKHFGLPVEVAPLITSLDGAGMSDGGSDADHPDTKSSLTKHIESRMEELSLNGFQKRFHGKSSGVFLIQAAMSLKEKDDAAPANVPKPLSNLRPVYWRPNSWEWMTSALPNPAKLNYPPPDLARKLVELAFRHALIITPMVHQPTFEAQWKANVYLRDINFARVYLMVCAVGSRFSDDERLFLRNDKGEVEWMSAGWVYFVQVLNMRRPLTAPVSLSDLQVTGLMCIFLQGSTAPHAGWLLAGLGLRSAIDIGTHREKVYSPDRPFENQMWKRVFWSLVALDRVSSVGFGRPTALPDEDIDAELPLDVDDEYYDDKKREWVQPEGKGTSISAFIHLIKLMPILGRALRTVYSLGRSKPKLGFVGADWEAQTVADLDSELNAWLDSTPDHLKWDPNMDDTYFEYATTIRLAYHYAQITVHRPFIPVLSVDGKVTPLSFPSLAICTNAARAVAHLAEELSKRGYMGTTLNILVIFTAGAILLISIWGVKKSNLRIDVSKQIEDVHRCLLFLRKFEKTQLTCGRFGDILTEMATIHDIPVPPRETEPAAPRPPPPSEPAPSRKRPWDDDVRMQPHASDAASTSTLTPNHGTPQTFATSSPTHAAVTPNMGAPYQNAYPPLPPNVHPSVYQPLVPTAMPAAGPSMPYDTAQTGPQQWEMYNFGGGPAYTGAQPDFATNALMAAGLPQTRQNASPNTLFQDFLGVFVETGAPRDAGMQTAGLWNHQGVDDMSWINDMFSTSAPTQPPVSRV